MTARRRPTALLVVVSLLASLLAAVGGTVATQVVTAAPAAAADLSGFSAGNIMSDEVFFDGTRIGEAALQQFLEQKGAGCSVGSDGSPCLKNYRVSTPSRSADAYCSGYAGAADERASTILVKVGRACGVNPQVLAVILQKEQGLVTTTGAAATATRYQRAMGFGCSDTAPCQEQYGGFFNQVYQAARQFQVYAARPGSYAHRAGATNAVRYHPNAACGTSPVYIVNQATAGLYNYTPYQPNAAALAAGYGTGDACSSYGNRNFWNYFTDWFGPTSGYGVSPQMTELWNAWGGGAGALGQPIASQRCDLVPTGCSQKFTNATIFWSPTTGAQAVGGLILSRWEASGGPAAGIGYPTSTVLSCDAGAGCTQTFESGVITWSGATGAQLVGGQIYQRWIAEGGLSAGIGYPTSTVLSCDFGAGCAQTFQSGLITWSGATGAHIIGGIIGARWQREGGATGALGYPTSTVLGCAASGCAQNFQRGAIAWSSATGVQVVAEQVAQAWMAAGGPAAGIGVPVESLVTCTGPCVQRFQSGVMTWSGSGSGQLVGGVIYRRWQDLGGLAAGIGYPTSTVQGCPATGCVQTFQSGAMTWSGATGAQLVGGLIWSRWQASGGLGAGIGVPTESVQSCPASGCVQQFQTGAVAWSQATGAHLVGGAIYGRWRAAGGAASALGYPRDTVLGCASSGCRQNFAGGAVTWSAATGAHAVQESVAALYLGQGAETVFGYPTTTVGACPGPDGCVQTFSAGAIDWTPERGALAITGPIHSRWAASGGAQAGIGRPLTSTIGCDQAAGCVQDYQGGVIASSSGTGAHLVGGQIYTLWKALGGRDSTLGLPTSTVLGCDPAAGCVQTFQGGSIRWSGATGAYRQ